MKQIWMVLALALLLAVSCQQTPDYPGYRLISKEFVEEVNAECLYLEHEKSGAKVFKIAADDANKTFAISFRTITDCDCGTPHILEHSVLEGSRNFPVKSPFDEMAKGSLRTFLNAMTGKDRTMYPVASMNTKDYFNLMHVYLDAVFNPLVLERPETFYQEGWHHELLDPADPVVYRGVVYNEMKGAFSSPDRELYYQTTRNLFPDICYRYSSGGVPEAIPGLSYEDFISYYKKYYHPSNGYIFLYGDADLGRELAFIDTAYLSHYERAAMELEIPKQEPFSEMKEVIRPYPASQGSSTDDQTMLRLSFVVGDGGDLELEMAMMVLRDVLVNQESAPLRLALQEAGIGRDITAYPGVLNQITFNMTVHNANTSDMDRFRETVFTTLEKVVDEGLDKEAVEGSINRIEFRLREGDDAQKGLTYLQWILDNWMYRGDPFTGLQYEGPLAAVKASLTSDYLERIIREKFLDNPHALLLALEPEPGMEARNTEKTEAELAAYKEGLSPEEIEDLIRTTEALIARQDAEDTPEALATIPKLSLEDVNPEAAWYEVTEKDAGGQKVLHYEAFTNNVLYTSFLFDLRTVDTDRLPYVRILQEVLGKTDTENFSYEELEKFKNIHTGGFSAGLDTYLDSRQGDLLLPKFRVDVKAVPDQREQMLELVEEVLLRTDFSDTARIRNLLNQHLARMESSVKGNGFPVALTRERSYHSEEGVFDETTNGISYYWFLKDLVSKYDQAAMDLVEDLRSLSAALFVKDHLVIGVTCSGEDYPSLAEGLAVLATHFPSAGLDLKQWKLDPEVKNEGLMAASKVQYVVQGANFRKLGYPYNGHMMVLNRVMRSEWLHPQIRVKGGAYGGFGSFNRNGEVFFGSYRDPNLAETLKNIEGTPDFLSGFQADQEEMTRFIIGTVAGLDVPRTASQRGNLALENYFSGRTREEDQKLRDEVLSTTLEDLHELQPMVKEVMDQKNWCVYGNEEKIQANRELFGSVRNVVE